MDLLKEIDESWNKILANENNKELLVGCINKIKYIPNENLCPDIKNIFNSFKYFMLNDLKVVIIGQDPYHTKDVANGLAFSTEYQRKIPPSLRNIINCLYDNNLIKIKMMAN